MASSLFSDTLAQLQDNVTLGWAGLKDLAAHAVGIDSHAAADAYAAQTARERKLSPTAAAKLTQAARTAEKAGLVEASFSRVASGMAVVDLGEGVAEQVKKSLSVPTWVKVTAAVLGIAVVVGVGVRVVRVVSP
jgi:hypothetical protein